MHELNIAESCDEGLDPPPELSVVLPCLNEADTLAACLEKARCALDTHGIAGEIIVADNGSTDGSAVIAERAGARVVHVEGHGYGSALMGGIAAARGRFIVMGDADASYDFLQLSPFVEKLREGYDLVQGCRLASGGGRVLPGAMPLLHRWWGNPMFSLMARRWFGAPIHDVHCGMRAFSRALYQGLNLRCTGMEFASEMIIRATIQGALITEVPITYHPDGRKAHKAHLRTFRDGWRHLRFYLLFSPQWLFLRPGGFLILLGLMGFLIAMPKTTIRGITFDVHTLLFASLFIITGYQSIFFAVFSKLFAVSEGLLHEDWRLTRILRVFTLERGMLVGTVLMLAGIAGLAVAIDQWWTNHFGALDYSRTMRWVIPGVTLTTLGFQTIMSSFFLSLLELPRRRQDGRF
jgi:glycosyltransferase involved in cell wall biosynthesis